MCELRAACTGRDLDREGWPTVSVIVPVRNEVAHLEQAVASILAQDYPLPFDVCLAVAPSDDGTERVAERIAGTIDRVSAIANPAGATPAGLNLAVRATAGSVVVRVDGHAELSPGYIRRAVVTMCRTGAVNVGGMQVPKPETPFEQAVATATTSWMGTGGATYRVGGAAGPVDTVYLGVFDRAAGDAVGWFDESLIRNQDYELNIRLRQRGGIVWFDPELRVGYRPRGSWGPLARQYYEYGWWKAEVLRRHPDSMRIRQLLPLVVTTAVLATLVGAVVKPRLSAVPAMYGSAVFAATRGRVRPAAVLATMHLGWGIGFWCGFATRPTRGHSTRVSINRSVA